MFITTFYSYKGGVGRTMALANVAAELASRGKSVLVADFDLEAPGLSNFGFHGCDPPAPSRQGLVDFIHAWLRDGATPDVRDYVCQYGAPTAGHGPIWLMPAGRVDESYGARLGKIDFNELYEHHNGFLLFEDLKSQWLSSLNIDYVLVDSGTGHTDVGGIW